MATVSGIVVQTGQQTGERRRFGEVIDDLARGIDSSDSTVRDAAADAWRAAVRSMNRKGLWPWEILDEDITLTANVTTASCNSIIKKPLAMHLLDQQNGTRYRSVQYQPYEQFIEKYSLDYSAEPTTYTIPNLFETGAIRWFPTPGSTYYSRFTYYRATPAPYDENEALEIPDYVIEVYMAFAWVEFLKRIPAAQKHFAMSTAIDERGRAFREIAHHVASPGDRSREVF